MAVGVPATLTVAEQALAVPGGAVKLDVLFIGAHPDDEAANLATFGQWNEFHGMEVGVITITRGEGGGNAVGLEEGPGLGMLREAEERTAVGHAGITRVFNLDALDFYYTASAPLSRQVWGGEDILNRIVRVVRATRPDVIVTMNPSAVEGNHGNHQQAAMYAVEAYLAAGDPRKFPEHADEGFSPWQPARILRAGANGTGKPGPEAVALGFTPTVASEVVFGAWNGRLSEREGKRWSELLDQARWAYVTQGWANMPASPKDPVQIPAAWYTVIHSRSPLVDPREGDEAALRGAALPIPAGLPLGTLIDVRPRRFEVVSGESGVVEVVVTARDQRLASGTLSLHVPDGWACSPAQRVPALRRGASYPLRFSVTAPMSADPGQHVRVEARLATANGMGTTFCQMRVAGAVEATIRPLEEIENFRAWTKGLGMKHLDALVPELFSVAQGRSRKLEVTVENFSRKEQSGMVALSLPHGFEAMPSEQPYPTLQPGGQITVGFEVSNTDASLPTANRGPNGGAWPVSVIGESKLGKAVRRVTMNLVPSHAAMRVQSTPVIDGVRAESEYPGAPLPVKTIWDGSPMGGMTQSVSGEGWLSFDDSNLYVFLSVEDDIRGTILPATDNKRQRRTDSVEIYVDPRGTATNTAHTLIAGIFPSMDTMTGGPGVGRDRDNWQGQADITAPGMEVAIVMADSPDSYDGYDLEVKIPFAVLPDNIDPNCMGFNIVINDSDTQNKAAQRRVGWSTFPGMRADPWRWGIVTLKGLGDKGRSPKPPKLPDSAASSLESPQSILQSSHDRVPLGGFAKARGELRVLSAELRGAVAAVAVHAPQAGLVRAYLWDGKQVLGSTVAEIRKGRTVLDLKLANGASSQLTVALSLETPDGVEAASAPVSRRR